MTGRPALRMLRARVIVGKDLLVYYGGGDKPHRGSSG